MAKTAVPDVVRFAANKQRINDYYEHNADTVREKRTVMATAAMFAEMAWLTHEIRRLGGLPVLDDLPRFCRIEKFIGRVCDDHAQAITTGQFVKVRADIFGAWRFLVRALEQVLKSLLAVEDQFSLGGRLQDEDDRITLDLEDGLGDEDETATPKRQKVRRPAQQQAAASNIVPTAGAMGDDDLPGGDDELVAGG